MKFTYSWFLRQSDIAQKCYIALIGTLTLSACETTSAAATTANDILYSCHQYSTSECNKWNQKAVRVFGTVEASNDSYIEIFPPKPDPNMELEVFVASLELNKTRGYNLSLALNPDDISEKTKEAFIKANGKNVSFAAVTDIECVMSSEYNYAMEYNIIMPDDAIVIAPTFCSNTGTVHLKNITDIEIEQ